MRVHLHTVCWNDADDLEFFFRHYEPWVEKFFIHDDGSNDGSLDMLAARKDVVVEPLQRTNDESWVLSAKHIYDTSWRRSKGEADWVIVTNIDEHIRHPDMPGYLRRCAKAGVTAIPALGYQMVSEEIPETGSLLWRDYPMGAPWANMSKMQMFDPNQVGDCVFAPGRHKVAFSGRWVVPDRDEAINLHFKYMGKKEVFLRHQEQNERLGEVDRNRSWGHKYGWDWDEYEADFEMFRAAAVDTKALDHHAAHREPRWWRDAEGARPKSRSLNRRFGRIGGWVWG